MNTDRRSGAPLPPHLVLIVGVLAVSSASTLIRLAQGDNMSSLAVAAWRLTIASLLLAPFALTRQREELRSLSRREWTLALASGALLALHFASWITSLAMTSVAASVVLVATNPLFVALASYFFLRERPSRLVVVGLVITTVGSVVVGLGDLGEGTHHLVGDGLALVGAIAGAGYFLIGRKLRARLSLLGYVFPVYATAAVILMTVALVSGVELRAQQPSTWLVLFLLALLPQVVGHSSLNWALRHLSATYVTIAALGEPIGSAVLAWLLLSEPPSVAAVVGGAMWAAERESIRAACMN